RISYEHIRHS
ncbi:phosphoribosylglycinamide synthetase, ATP-grasp domain protein, partial [Chlamydia psittaci 02DC14]